MNYTVVTNPLEMEDAVQNEGIEADGALLTTAEASAVLRTPVATLRYWRHVGTGPKSFTLGARKVFYKRSDLDAWIEQQYAAGVSA